eukprot:CAMPEP_0170552320 /NCGR_PEP_ID=MMETSP0211-20121228/10216_1 /TAXON_ID=311385 /ORGANISM="Pseudokeronopsis sp., Strain OXSARD2" /LENGTH=95 /DNA_ID=CAMNT_0010859957 /DNA_START=308 /DNA_END=595 /DNA_ORIENTATION=-
MIIQILDIIDEKNSPTRDRDVEENYYTIAIVGAIIAFIISRLFDIYFCMIVREFKLKYLGSNRDPVEMVRIQQQSNPTYSNNMNIGMPVYPNQMD